MNYLRHSADIVFSVTRAVISLFPNTLRDGNLPAFARMPGFLMVPEIIFEIHLNLWRNLYVYMYIITMGC